jgi:thiol-disulfide isomerase/thioredoxin
MSFVNQYSFLWIAALGLGLAAFLLLRRSRGVESWISLGALAAGLLLAFLLFSPGSQAVDPNADVAQQIGAGTPVLLEFQSPYCLACMAAKPAVDSLEQRYAGKLIVLRLNLQDAAGRELASRFGAGFTPTFVLLDGAGQTLWQRVGAIDPAEVEQSLGAP